MRLSGVVGCAAAESADIAIVIWYLTLFYPCDRILPTGAGARLRRRGARADRGVARHAALRLQRRGDRVALSRHRRGVRRSSARDPLRVESKLDARRAAPAARPGQQRRRQFGRRDRRGAARRLHSRRRSSSPASARQTPSSLTRSSSACDRSTSNRKGSSSGSRRCRGRGKSRTKIAIRVNPDVDARTHPHISTGLKTNKFGIPIDDVAGLCARTRGRPNVEIVGLHAHVGSQITDLEPLTRAAGALVGLARQLAIEGTAIEHLDIGGGLGVSYDGSAVPDARDYAAAVLPILRESGLSIVLEPGRHIVAPAGALLTRVVDVKPAGDGRLFVIMDAGMTEIIRPMMYNAFHRIEPVLRSGAPEVSCDVVGPLLREQRHAGQEPDAAAAAGRRALRRARRGRLWLGDGVELQPPPAAGGGAGRVRGAAVDPAAADTRRSARAGSLKTHSQERTSSWELPEAC